MDAGYFEAWRRGGIFYSQSFRNVYNPDCSPRALRLRSQGGFGTVFEWCGGRFGVILASFSPLGCAWGAPGLIGVARRGPWGSLGRPLGVLGRPLGVHGAALGAHGEPLGRPCAHHGGPVSVQSAVLGASGRPPGGPRELPLGACRATMKAHFWPLGCPGASPGGPWGALGPSRWPPGAPWGAPGAPRSAPRGSAERSGALQGGATCSDARTTRRAGATGRGRGGEV